MVEEELKGSLVQLAHSFQIPFTRDSAEAGQRRTRKEGSEFKMVATRRNMYTVQSNSGSLCVPGVQSMHVSAKDSSR